MTTTRSVLLAARSVAAKTAASSRNRSRSKAPTEMPPLHDLGGLRPYPPPAAVDDATEAVAASLRRDPTDASHYVRDRLATLDAAGRTTAVTGAAHALEETQGGDLEEVLPDVGTHVTTPATDVGTSATGAPAITPGPTPSAAVHGEAPVSSTPVPSVTTPGPPPPTPSAKTPAASPGAGAAITDTTSAGAPAAAGQDIGAPVAVAAEDPTAMPHVQDRLGPVQDEPVRRDDSAGPQGPVDVPALVRELTGGAVIAGQEITKQSRIARYRLRHRADKTREGVRTEMERADAHVHTVIKDRRAELDSSLKESHDHIDAQCSTRLTEVKAKGDQIMRDLLGVYMSHRGGIANEKKTALEKVERVRKAEKAYLREGRPGFPGLNELHALALHNADINSRVWGRDTVRGRIKGDAAQAVGLAAAKAFKDVEPKADQAIDTLVGEIAAAVEHHTNLALIKYMEVLPSLSPPVDKGVKDAQDEIRRKAASAHEELVEPARDLHRRLNLLERQTIERHATVRGKVDAQVERERTQIDGELRTAATAAIQPLGQVTLDAIEVLGTADALSPSRSRQFVDEVLGFLRDATGQTGADFGEASADIGKAMSGVVPDARTAFRRIDKALTNTVDDEGVTTDLVLMDFNVAVTFDLGETVTDLEQGGVKAATAMSDKLAAMVAKFGRGLIDLVDAGWREVRKSVTAALGEQNKVKWELGHAMGRAAAQAAWEYDSPYMKHVVKWTERILGFLGAVLVIIGAIVMIILIAKGIIAGLAAALGYLIGAALAKAVATFVVTVATLYIFVVRPAQQAYQARKAANQTGVRAFFGALADVTGLTEIARSFTDPKLTPFEQGAALGRGIGQLLGFVIPAAMLIKGMRTRMPPEFTNPEGGSPALDVAAAAGERASARPPVLVEEPIAPAEIPVVGEPAGAPPKILGAEPGAKAPMAEPPAVEPTAPRSGEGHAIIDLGKVRAEREAAARRQTESARMPEPAPEPLPAPEPVPEPARPELADEPHIPEEGIISLGRRRAEVDAAKRSAAEQARAEQPVVVKRTADGTVVEVQTPATTVEPTGSPTGGASSTVAASRGAPPKGGANVPRGGRVSPVRGGTAGAGGSAKTGRPGKAGGAAKTVAAPKTGRPARIGAPSGRPPPSRLQLIAQRQRALSAGRPRPGRSRPRAGQRRPRRGGGGRGPRRLRVAQPGRQTVAQFRTNMRTSPHGFVYRIVDQVGNILKWGTAVNPFSRISGYEREGVQFYAMEVMEEASRAQQLAAESFEAGEILSSGAEGLNIRMNTLEEMGGGEWFGELFVPEHLHNQEPLIIILSRAAE